MVCYMKGKKNKWKIFHLSKGNYHFYINNGRLLLKFEDVETIGFLEVCNNVL
jgi:hypothetical protein